MQLTVNTKDILEGLAKSAAIIPAKTGAAFLRTIWLRADERTLTIMSTDSSLEFKGTYAAEVTQPGLTGVLGRNFFELVKRLPQGAVKLELSPEGKTLKVSQGRRIYKLPTSEPSWFTEFSAFPEGEPVLWSGDYLSHLIDSVSYCISDEETMEAMHCMFFNPTDEDSKIEVCGLNGHQFAMVTFFNADVYKLLPEGGILIGKRNVNELKKWLSVDEIELSLSQKRLFVRTSDHRETFSLPLSYYQYPDYHAFVNKLEDGQDKLSAERDELLGALDRINIFATDAYRCTNFNFSGPDQVTLTSTGHESGVADEPLEAAYSGSLTRISFPTKDLMDILAHFRSSKVELALTGVEGPAGISGNEDQGYLVIIMPMKISEETYFAEEAE